jgi:hypothetical protein
MDITFPVLAGIASTVIFACGNLPMLVKARRSKDLASYSFGNLALSNVGNAVHSVYVFSLPPGPVWALHSFYVVAALLMFVWYLRYQSRGLRRNTQRRPRAELPTSPDAVPAPVFVASLASARNRRRTPWRPTSTRKSTSTRSWSAVGRPASRPATTWPAADASS